MEAALALADHLDESAILAMHARLLGQRRLGGPRRQIPRRAGLDRPEPDQPARRVARRPAGRAGARGDGRPGPLPGRDDVPVIVQAAVAHAQFETIHPFADGNGRTGRALVHAILRGKGVMTRTTAPVSAGLLTDTEAYFSALGAYRRGDARPIVEQFTRASRYAAFTGERLVDDLAALVDAARGALTDACGPRHPPGGSFPCSSRTRSSAPAS